jgi:hypothetical protein
MANTSSTWQSIINNNAPLIYMLWTDQNFQQRSEDTLPLSRLEPGLGVFDISHADLDRIKTYSGIEICIVSELNSNCI